MRVVWQLLTVVAIAMIGGQSVVAVQANPWLTFAVGLLAAALAIATYGWVVRRTERRPSIEVSRQGAVGGLALGTLIGIAIFVLVIVNIAFLGDYHLTGLGSVSGAIGMVGFMAGAAVTEELLFRGFLFRTIEERTGTWIALTLTGALFGAYHLLNPHASLWGAIAIAIEAGGMLTAAYVATRKLWVPIGLHFGWNFAAAGIFSTEVSGNGSNQVLLDATMSGPTLVTGGEFGPEGSLYSVVFCVLAAAAFMWVAKRRDAIVPVGGHRRPIRAEATAKLAP